MTVRVGKTAKTFRLVIGTGTNQKHFTLGHYPTVSLAAAREKAPDIIAKEQLRTPNETWDGGARGSVPGCVWPSLSSLMNYGP